MLPVLFSVSDLLTGMCIIYIYICGDADQVLYEAGEYNSISTFMCLDEVGLVWWLRKCL